MTTLYDCTKDVIDHIERVRYWLFGMREQLVGRAERHDASKLKEPEKPMFDEFTSKLKELTFGSEEYKAALAEMGEALKHHYANNRHHPEHYPNGVNGMTLIDVIEMVCDWMAAAQAKNVPVDIDYLAQRFGITGPLFEVIVNTLHEEDLWNEINGVPVGYFTLRKYQDRPVEGFERTKQEREG